MLSHTQAGQQKHTHIHTDKGRERQIVSEIIILIAFFM